MQVHGLFFEANSIQSYILLGGRLRDVVGASHLIDELCNSTLSRTMEVAGVECSFVRRAAGAFYAIFDGDPDGAAHAKRLAAAWSATVRHVCPGLGFNLVAAQGTTVFDCVHKGTTALNRSKAQPIIAFPLALPLVERSLRTGLPAVEVNRVGTLSEMVDAAVLARRRDFGKATADAVGARLLAAIPRRAPAAEWRFPRNLEFDPPEDGINTANSLCFPFDGQSRYLAVIHADANGLGQKLINMISTAALLHSQGDKNVAEQYKALLPSFSKAIEQSMEQATRAAIQHVLLPATRGQTIPARPLVLAGDDLSMLVRADLAVSFIQHLLKTFEETSHAALAALAANPQFSHFADVLRGGLTACAGMVFVKNNHPFVHALHLAEDLCLQAKKVAKDPSRIAAAKAQQAASAVAFIRLTESDQVATERKLERVQGWGLGKHSEGMAQLSGLLELAQAVSGIARGPLRRLLSTAELSQAEAATDFERWRTLMARNAPQQLKQVEAALIHIQPGSERFGSFRVGRPDGPSALPDLIDLLAVRNTQTVIEHEEELA